MVREGAQIDNPILREFWWIVLFTGLRRRTVTAMAWAHVATDRVTIPNPKGGKKKAFNCPLTPPMLRSLDRLRRAGAVLCDQPKCKAWVFPSVVSKSGHIEEMKHSQCDDASPHSLRHSFRGFCEGAKVSKLLGKLLMNHKISGDVHDAYMGEHFDQLLKASGDVAGYILRHLPQDAEAELEARLKTQLTSGPDQDPT